MDTKKCSCSDSPKVSLWGFVSKIVFTTIVVGVVVAGIWAIANGKLSS